jgi:hypothetical protein
LTLPLLWCTCNTPPPSVACSFSCPCLLFKGFFCGIRGLVCPGGYAGLSQGCLWEYHMMLGAHLLVCRMSPKQVWSKSLVVWESSYFLSVMWCGEALYRLGVQGVEVLILLGAFFLSSVAPSVSARFLIYRAHAICFCTLVTILDPPPNFLAMNFPSYSFSKSLAIQPNHGQ